MPGIADLYVWWTNEVITKHERAGTLDQISRASAERTLLREIDKGSLSIDWKMAWYHAILQTNHFDALWQATALRLNLPPSVTTRYIPDESLASYNIPTSATHTRKTTPSRNRKINPARSMPPPSSPHKKARRGVSPSVSSVTTEETEETEQSTIDATARLLAKQLGGSSFEEEGEGAGAGDRDGGGRDRDGGGGGIGGGGVRILDMKGLERQEGDDGEFGTPSKKKKVGDRAGKGQGGRTGGVVRFLT